MAEIPNMMMIRVLLHLMDQIIPNLDIAELEYLAPRMNERTQRITEQLEREHQVEARPRNTRFYEMTHRLPDGTLVRHKTTNGHEAIGRYNAQQGVLEWEGQTFRYPSGFAAAHVAQIDSNGRTNGWGRNVCHAFLDGRWVSLHILR